jgi:iron(III) transport system ATP-binding protein
MSFLALRDVCKSYGGVAALEAVSLALPEASRTAIVGPSGSGKTTILRLIAGFEAPDSGQIALDGAIWADGPAILPAHRRGVGIVMQDGALFPHLSIAENIGFGLDSDTPDRASRIQDLLRMVELDPALLDRRPDTLSGGQQQRVAIARALARRPRLMLLDEPFSALDTGLRASTRRAVARLLADAGVTTILVTHDQEEALSFAEHVAVMGAGRLLQSGTPQALYLHPVDPMVAAFLGEAILLPAQLADGTADCALGRIPVQDRAAAGSRTIMLRPGQIALRRAAAKSSAGAAEVIEIDFQGALCRLALRLCAPSHLGMVISVQQQGYDLPSIGETVGITVNGTAHVFSAPR